jgi:hypothetical protein
VLEYCVYLLVSLSKAFKIWSEAVQNMLGLPSCPAFVLAAVKYGHELFGKLSPAARFEKHRFVQNFTHLATALAFTFRFLFSHVNNHKKSRPVKGSLSNFGRAKSTPSKPLSHMQLCRRKVFFTFLVTFFLGKMLLQIS